MEPSGDADHCLAYHFLNSCTESDTKHPVRIFFTTHPHPHPVSSNLSSHYLKMNGSRVL